MGRAALGTEVGAPRAAGEPRSERPARADGPGDDRPAPDDRAVRADDVMTLSRLATKRGAVRAILEWLAHRTGGVATLIDADGAPAVAPAPPPSPALRAGTGAVAGLHRRGTPSAVLSVPADGDHAEPAGDSTVFLVAPDGPGRRPARPPGAARRRGPHARPVMAA